MSYGMAICLLLCRSMLTLIYPVLVYPRHVLHPTLTLSGPFDIIHTISPLHELQHPTAMLEVRIYMFGQDQSALTTSAAEDVSSVNEQEPVLSATMDGGTNAGASGRQTLTLV